MIQLLHAKTKYVNTAGLFTIDELKCAVSMLDLFISVDSGPIYIAEAVGVPTVDIVGPMDEKEQPPISENNIVVVPKRDEPMLHIMNARVYNVVEAQRQIDSISVSDVQDALRPLINKIYHA